MTKKDYELLAAAFARSAWRWKGSSFRVVEQVILEVVDDLEENNPRFNREKFLKASGII